MAISLYHPKSLYRRILFLEAASVLKRYRLYNISISDNIARIPCSLEGKGKSIIIKLKAYNGSYCNQAMGFLYIDMNRDAIVYLNSKPHYGYDKYHRYIPIDNPCIENTVELKMYTTFTFGEHSETFRISRIDYIVVLKDLWSLAKRLRYLLEVIDLFKDHWIAYELSKILRETLDHVYVDTITMESLEAIIDLLDHSLGTYHELVDDLKILLRDRSKELCKAGLRSPDYDRLLKNATLARKYLDDNLLKLNEKYWREGSVYIVSHAHIDAAWLWSWHETIGKIARTALNVLYALRGRNELVFVQSSALYYKWLKEYYPDIYSKVIEAMAKGIWEPVGGMWVESDMILTPLESIIRQFFYGQRFFIENFGMKSRIAWLPDSFGFNPILPQIMKSAGIEYFTTHKLCWNKYNEFPYHIFKWKGLDGTEIVSQLMLLGYGTDVKPSLLKKLWDDFKEKHIFPKPMYVFGYGDGGGGITLEHVEKIDLYRITPLLPKIETGKLNNYINEIIKRSSELPIWRGELYLEMHRGTYTTNLRIKKLVYEADKLLRHVETLSAIACSLEYNYPLEEIDRLWHTLLLNEFHDILSGSSINSVYRTSYSELGKLIERSRRLIEEAIENISKHYRVSGMLVFNPLPWSVKTYIELKLDKNLVPIDQEGNPLAIQKNKDKTIVELDLEPLSLTSLGLADKNYSKEVYGDGVRVEELDKEIIVENRYYRVIVGKDGVIKSLYDKELGDEIMEKPSNVLVAYEDKPHEWDAWDIDEDYEKLRWVINYETRPEIIEQGPLRVIIRFKWRYRDSTIVQDMIMYSSRKEILFKTVFDWHERNILVKTWFYPRIYSDYAYYDMGAGYLTRPTHRNTSWERAKFEVYKHKWVALRNDAYLFSIISHERNGVSVKENEIGLSLLKSPLYPNPLSDYGHIDTYYAITTLDSDKIYELNKIAYELMNSPYVIKKGKYTDRTYSVSFIKVYGDAIIENIKKCHNTDNCIIVRIYNPINKDINVTLRTWVEILKAYDSNILEHNIEELNANKDEIMVKLRPFEIKTIKMHFRQ